MLMDRIIGAFMFRREVYAEVEKDESFTMTAWFLVIVVAFFSRIGSNASADSVFGWMTRTVIGTVFAVIGFAVAALVINWLGRTMFNAEVSFEELVRTMGLAYVWNVVGFAGILGVIPALGCLVAPVIFLAWILGIAAWLIAVKEALDLDWGSTVVTVVVGWIAQFVVWLIAGLVMGILGLGAAIIGGLLG